MEWQWAAAAGIVVIVVAVGGGATGRAGPATAMEIPTTATLVGDRTVVAPGQSLRLAVRIELAPGWHTYWRNPGDAGVAPAVAWRLPAGFTAGAPRLPPPERFHEGPFVVFGYADEAWILTEMQVNTAAVRGPAVLSAEVEWAVCREVCIPNRQTVTLPVTVATESAALPPDENAAVARAWARLPQPFPQPASLAADGGGVVLSVPVPDGAVFVPLDFFPYEEGVIDDSIGASFARRDGRVEIRLKRAAGAPMSRLDGIVTGTGNGKPVAWEVSAVPP